jgi:hypothetical protein
MSNLAYQSSNTPQPWKVRPWSPRLCFISVAALRSIKPCHVWPAAVISARQPRRLRPAPQAPLRNPGTGSVQARR